MKNMRYTLLAALYACILTSCGDCGCGSTPIVNDTEFTIAYKLVDGSWDTTQRVLPHATTFWVGPTAQGTYALYYNSDNDSNGNVFKAAVIDYNVVNTKLVLDTATRKVELVDPD